MYCYDWRNRRTIGSRCSQMDQRNRKQKPVVGFIAGETAPKGRTMGHAGAIVGGSEDTAEAKKRIMKECGIHVVDSPAQIGAKVAEVLKK